MTIYYICNGEALKTFRYVSESRHKVLIILKIVEIPLNLHKCYQLHAGLPREFRGPGAKEKDEAPCERSELKILFE